MGDVGFRLPEALTTYVHTQAPFQASDPNTAESLIVSKDF